MKTSFLVILFFLPSCFANFIREDKIHSPQRSYGKKIGEVLVNFQYIEKEIFGFEHEEGLSYSLDGGRLVQYKEAVGRVLRKSNLFTKFNVVVFDERGYGNEQYYMSIDFKEETNKPLLYTIASLATVLILPLKKEKTLYFKSTLWNAKEKICEVSTSKKINSYFSPYLLFINLFYLDAFAIADYIELSLNQSLEKCYESIAQPSKNNQGFEIKKANDK